MEGKRPLGRSRRKRDDNIKLDVKVKGYGDVDCIQLAENRVYW
jgi:hypothetical protein